MSGISPDVGIADGMALRLERRLNRERTWNSLNSSGVAAGPLIESRILRIILSCKVDRIPAATCQTQTSSLY